MELVINGFYAFTELMAEEASIRKFNSKLSLNDFI